MIFRIIQAIMINRRMYHIFERRCDRAAHILSSKPTDSFSHVVAGRTTIADVYSLERKKRINPKNTDFARIYGDWKS